MNPETKVYAQKMQRRHRARNSCRQLVSPFFIKFPTTGIDCISRVPQKTKKTIIEIEGHKKSYKIPTSGVSATPLFLANVIELRRSRSPLPCLFLCLFSFPKGKAH